MSAYQYDPEEQLVSERTIKETDKKCPNCGATVVFNPATGGMHCDYCGYSYELPKADTENNICEIDLETAIHTESFNWGEQKKSVECKQCGAVSIYDVLETAAVCPFCGSTNVMPAATNETITPNAVCPFSVTKAQASEYFTKWLRKKWFAPRKARKKAEPDAFQGVYLPYWTFDTQTTSNFAGRAGHDKIKDEDGNGLITKWEKVDGVYQEFFDDVTVLGSKRQVNSGVKECEPFDFSKMVPYTPQALAGFIAERYSVGLQEGWESAKKHIQFRIKTNMDSYICKHWHADRADVKFSTIYNNTTYKYLLVPTWISSFKYKNKVYQFAVNGQTGKVGGQSPVSVWKVLLAVVIGLGICYVGSQMFN